MCESIKTLNEENFNAVIQDEKLTLVCFSASWCGPCKALHPIIEEIGREKSGEMNVCFADVDDCIAPSENYRVMSVPTIIIFKEGSVCERTVGYKSKADILAIIDKHSKKQ
ncbi:MAG: thioredoxin fold domain-containing protein [Christensenellaceae bacterium]|jgi:thioredoxin 1|nr:thioredoxin fold domain-containing protein [Christensenellaceae bacterium]